MKKVMMLLVVCSLVAVMMLTGCSESSNNSSAQTPKKESAIERSTRAFLGDRFMFVESLTGYSSIVADTETGVEYLFFFKYGSDSSGVSLSPLYNADGSMIIYNGR